MLLNSSYEGSKILRYLKDSPWKGLLFANCGHKGLENHYDADSAGC